MNDVGNPISRIEKAYKASHIGWDFAAKNDWRNCKSFLFNTETRSNPDDIFTWLQEQRTNEIACEAVFQLNSGAHFFFGVGTTHLTYDERTNVIGKFLKMPQDGTPLGETVDGMRNILGNKRPLDKTPELLALGVGGLWDGVGSLVIWRNDGSEKLTPFEAIQMRAPEPKAGFLPLYVPQPNNIMIEAVMGTDGWLGFPVSTSDKSPPERHTLSKNAYYSVTNILSGYNLGS